MESIPPRQDHLYKVVLDTVSDGITIVDTDFRISFQNKIITKVYGGSLVAYAQTVAGETAFGDDYTILEFEFE